MEEIEKVSEEKYLNLVQREIFKQLKENETEFNLLNKRRLEFSEHFSDDYYTMDDEETAQETSFIEQYEELMAVSNKKIDKLNRQKYSPYFGRIDFKLKGHKKPNSYYIGVNNLLKRGKEIPLICDWRAPVSSLFYDYELGEAKYHSPNGEVVGNIDLKRQFEIKNGKLLNCFNSSLTIGDEILKGILSQNASKKMQTIIGTIQKEQNKVIRQNINKNIIVQGVAGSGKTQIALHRIAYLLYQNRDTLKAENILILSPNTLFSDYISDVLPELGEENMEQTSFFKIAKSELSFLKKGLQTREENLNESTKNFNRLNEVAYKNTYDFYESLKIFCEKYFELNFVPKDIKFGKTKISAQEMKQLYNVTYKTKTPAVRVEWIIDYILDKLDIVSNLNDISLRLKKMIYPFFMENNILNIYSDFLQTIGMSFCEANSGHIRYDDLGPLLYIKNYFLGLKKYSEIKYLIIDEMQDYSFVQYDVFSTLFDCKKIILGDINQCIDKIMDKKDLEILSNMLKAEIITLNKAYRSTFEITEFANKIKNIDCDIVARHGEKPQELSGDVANKITKVVNESIDYDSFAILTKNADEAKILYSKLSQIDDLTLCLDGATKLTKVSIMPSFLAKGMEFDCVIIPNKNGYKTMLEKNLLYISCTRALHKLVLIS